MNEIVISGPVPTLPRASQSQSIFRRAFDQITGGGATSVIARTEESVGVGHVAAFFDSFGHLSLGAGAGGMFGFLAKHDMIEYEGHHVDAWAAAVAAVVGVWLAKYTIGQTARTFAGNAASVWAFRQVSGWKASAAGHATAPAASHHGDFDIGTDPIAEAAKGM